MSRRVDDWLRQTDKDLRHAKNALKDGDYEWSCFASKQAKGKTLKALYLNLGEDSFEHLILKIKMREKKFSRQKRQLLKALCLVKGNAL